MGLFRDISEPLLKAGQVVGNASPVPFDLSIAGLKQSDHHFYRCAFACAVCPYIPENLALIHGEANVADDWNTIEAFSQVVNFQDRHVYPREWPQVAIELSPGTA